METFEYHTDVISKRQWANELCGKKNANKFGNGLIVITDRLCFYSVPSSDQN